MVDPFLAVGRGCGGWGDVLGESGAVCAAADDSGIDIEAEPGGVELDQSVVGEMLEGDLVQVLGHLVPGAVAGGAPFEPETVEQGEQLVGCSGAGVEVKDAVGVEHLHVHAVDVGAIDEHAGP
ncbi:hypothetical protein ACIBUY_04375 [Streptomyces sp. NPDC050085]|uniref:hypothetical protein n=1 Tax=Streptomyces sp. NPDC050085 TaxID=3365600 RepID=UPI0037B28D6B